MSALDDAISETEGHKPRYGKIAGHEFDSLDRCSCGKRWTNLMHTTRDQIGEDGVAHYGKLNEAEYSSIEDRRNFERAWIWAALVGVATGSGPVVVPVAEEL